MDAATRYSDSNFPRKSALLVDSESEVSAVLHGVLNPEDWNIVHAADNLAVLKLVEVKPFDLIVTGARSTGKEDVDLLRKIRRVRPHVRLIILTDENTSADVIAAIRAGAFSYFSKPISTDSLAELVRNATSEAVWDDGIEVVSATPEWIRIIARCDKGTAGRLVQFLEEMVDLPQPEREHVASAFREMLLNAIEHGGHFDPNQYVEISYVRTRKVVMCKIRDPGQGFSLEELHHAAINNPSDDPIRHSLVREAQSLRPGGYGILLSKHYVDELMYSERGNEVLLIKYVRPLGAAHRSCAAGNS
jgi:CheY-like chemotaxis protein